MKVISVINLKGGVGKTFTTIQMGYYLYRSGYKVLLIDNDKQGNLSKFYRVYANTAAGDQHLRYKRITEQAKRAGYDYVLIDNPPDMGLNVVNALMVTDDVIVTLKIDEWALEDLDIILEQVNTARALNSGIRLAGTLITNYRNNDANVAGVEWLHANKYNVFRSRIRHSDKAIESIFFHQPVKVYIRSASAIDYKAFMREYLGQKAERAAETATYAKNVSVSDTQTEYTEKEFVVYNLRQLLLLAGYLTHDDNLVLQDIICKATELKEVAENG